MGKSKNRIAFTSELSVICEDETFSDDQLVTSNLAVIGEEEENELYDVPLDEKKNDSSLFYEPTKDVSPFGSLSTDLEFARFQRRAIHGHNPPMVGLWGLASYLQDLRSDLAWLNERNILRERGEELVSWQEFDESSGSKASSIPVVSNGLLIVCTLALLYSFVMAGARFETIGRNPSLGPKDDALVAWGAVSTDKIMDDGEWHRIVSAIFLHGGILHLLINAIGILLVGQLVERAHGSVVTAIVFVVSGVAANLLSAVFSPFTISVGASGGICGWLGLCMVDCIVHWPLLKTMCLNVYTLPSQHIAWIVVADIVTMASLGVLPWIDNWAHIGGFLFGACIGLILSPCCPKAFAKSHAIRRPCYFSVKLASSILGLMLILSTVLFLYQSQDIGELPCRNCNRYVSCSPFGMFKQFCDPCTTLHDAAAHFRSDDVSILDVELHCPYGDFASFVTTTVPNKHADWVTMCHSHCDL